MSSRVKKCKTCGTTDVENFAPRKSAICKSCDSPKIVEASTIQNENVTTVSENISEPKIIENVSETKIIENVSENIHEKVKILENQILELQASVLELSKLKKLFPRIFPEN